MEGDVIVLQELFVFRVESIETEGKVVGRFEMSGIRPRFVDRLKASSQKLDPAVVELFSR
jgi:pilus assembly protein CpaF